MSSSPTKRRKKNSDLQAAREASSQWLHSVWDSLADKYGDISDDDEIDLDTMTVRHAQGHLSRIPCYHFGSFQSLQRPETAETSDDDLDGFQEGQLSPKHLSRLRQMRDLQLALKQKTGQGTQILEEAPNADADQESDDPLCFLPPLSTPKSTRTVSASVLPDLASLLDVSPLKPSSVCSQSTATSSATRQSVSACCLPFRSSNDLYLSDSEASSEPGIAPYASPIKRHNWSSRKVPNTSTDTDDTLSRDAYSSPSPTPTRHRPPSSATGPYSGPIVYDSEPERHFFTSKQDKGKAKADPALWGCNSPGGIRKPSGNRESALDEATGEGHRTRHPFKSVTRTSAQQDNQTQDSRPSWNCISPVDNSHAPSRSASPSKKLVVSKRPLKGVLRSPTDYSDESDDPLGL